jgi:hypothetical protein
MIHALDWYGDDDDGDDNRDGYQHYTNEPDFGGLHIRVLVVDDDLLRHDEESSNLHFGYHGDHGARRPVYDNDRYHKDWYHSDDDEGAAVATINSHHTIDEYNYYAFDDDAKRDPWRDHRHDAYPTTASSRQYENEPPPIQNQTCRRVSWHREMHLNCLNFHEFDFGNHVLQGSSKYIG